MSRKNNLSSFQTIASQTMGASTLTSSVTDIQWLDDIGFQFNFTGSPIGAFEVQVSSDYKQDYLGNVEVAGNWVPIVFTYWNGTQFITGTDIPTSVGSPIYLDLALLSAPYIRVQYIGTGGSGVLTAIITGKMV